jgi:hypothetical protein
MKMNIFNHQRKGSAFAPDFIVGLAIACAVLGALAGTITGGFTTMAACNTGAGAVIWGLMGFMVGVVVLLKIYKSK